MPNWARVSLLSTFLLLSACKKGREQEPTPKPTEPATSATSPTAAPSPAPEPVKSEATAKTPTVPSKFPGCSKVALPDERANVDAAAKLAIEALGTALATNDPTALTAVLGPWVEVGTGMQTSEATVAKLATDGPQAFIGFEPEESFDTATNTKTCAWTLKITKSTANEIEIFTGSGYGSTKIAKLARVNGDWKVVGFKTVDYGAP